MSQAGEIVIFITSPGLEEAQRIAGALLDRRTVACVNVIPGVKSFFWWQGKRESETEVLMVAKSTAALLPEVIALVKENHPYEVPEVIALPIVGGLDDYLGWIRRETRAAEGGE